MKKVFIKLGLFLFGIILVLTPFGIFKLVAHNQPHIYSKTYYAALVDKVHYLDSIKNEKKIILVGGSNVAFGFNSKLIEQEFPEYKVANFGLYAMLGTKIMMDLALEYVNSGDLVFVIPEINSQSTSLYFNSTATLKAIEDDISILFKLNRNNFEQTVGEYFNFVKERSSYSSIIEPSGVYQRKNFNKWGDIEYLGVDEFGEVVSLRTQNQMSSRRFIDPRVKFDSNDISIEFVNYLNNYCFAVNKKGASLFYEFSPVNSLSLDCDEQSVVNYYWFLREKLHFNVVGNPLDYVIDPHYFYDSNFHLNDSGAILRSFNFVSDMYRDIFKVSKAPSFDLPSMPDYPEEDILDEDDDPMCIYFDLEEIEGGYCINSIKEGYDESEIRLPIVYNHKYVMGISEYTFIKSPQLETIYVPTCYTYFENKAFDDSNLKKVYLEQTAPEKLGVDFTGGLINNVKQGFKIMVPRDSYQSYLTDYNWQFYKNYLEAY